MGVLGSPVPEPHAGGSPEKGREVDPSTVTTCKERLRAGTVEPGEEMTQRAFISMYKYLVGQEGEARLFLMVFSGRKTSSGYKV